MKKAIILFVMSIVVLLPTIAQRNEKSLYEHKVKVYSRVSKTGWVLTGIGTGCVIGGAIALATLPDDYLEYNGYYDESDDLGDGLQALAGYVSIGLGIGMITGGIIMGSIGTRKLRYYKGKLNDLSFAPVITPKVQGFSLVYRF